MELEVGQKVNLIIGVETALGYTVLINESQEGLLFRSEVFKDIEEGMKTVGYIKNIREDGKIDVSLRPQGYLNAIDLDKSKILEKLEQNRGSLPLTDKSSPDAIKFRLQMSKKAFKKAIGALYKEKKIVLDDDKISLV